MKEIILLFLGSALFSIGCRALLRKQKRSLAADSAAERVPRDQMPCFKTLSSLFHPPGVIYPQVRLTDLFEVRPERGRQPLYERIDGLHLDFLVADSATGRPLCGIALDDHLPRDPVIEGFFTSHDLLLLRIPRGHLADPATFRAALARLNRPAPRHSPPRSGARDSG